MTLVCFKQCGYQNTAKMKRILIVEDDLSTRKLIEYLLQPHYEIMSASNGVEAKTILINEKLPDLIITDIEMPKMDGVELISELQNGGELSAIPIMVLSGNEPESLQEQLAGFGVNAFLKKPVQPKTLFWRVEECLGKLVML